MSCSSKAFSRLGALLVAHACACSPSTEPAGESYTRIDDMEGEGSRIPWQAPHTDSGAGTGRWQSFADIGCSSLVPPPTSLDADRWTFTDVPKPYTTFSGASSTRAARLSTTEPLVNTWGAGMRFDFTSTVDSVEPSTEPPPDDLPCPTAERDLSEWPAEAVDLRDYRGVTFFGMADAAAGTTRVSVLLLDRNSDPRGLVCDETQASATECFNSFASEVELGPDFKRFQVDFSDLSQDPQWGYRLDEPDLEHVYGVAFQVFTPGGVCPEGAVCPGDPPSLTFDIWIDDVYFVNR